MKRTEIIIYIFVIILLLAFGVAGTYTLGQRGGFNTSISLLDAAFFTIVTISTVGYGNIYPVSDSAKIFTMTLIIIGIGIFFSIIVAISSEFMNDRIQIFTGRVSSFEKRGLSKHVILIGSGATNTYLAEKLYERKERFIIITSEQETAEHMKKLGYKAYIADATSDIELAEFAPNKAKAIIIDVKDSSRAIYSLLVAKELAGSAKIVVVAPSKDAEHHLRNIASGKATIINPADIAASSISDSIFK
jgi:voltage-gated potassium channel